MDERQEDRRPPGTRSNRGPSDSRRKERGGVATAARALRAVTAVLVFGVPLVTGTAALLGYGAYRIYKRMTG